MDIDELMSASKVIVARNVDHHVLAATVFWDGNRSALYLTWYVDRPPSDDDEELCELSLGELLAQFTEVARAYTRCVHAQSVEDLAHTRRVAGQLHEGGGFCYPVARSPARRLIPTTVTVASRCSRRCSAMALVICPG